MPIKLSSIAQKKKLRLNEFAIEITRKCNMKCAHCLRGEAQKRDIHKKYITKVYYKCI